MIVRLMGEGQYELDSKYLDEMNRIDNNIVEIVTKGDEKTFKTEFMKLTECVRRNGKKVADEIIEPSDIIIPPDDLTLEEAREIFTGHGLIPD
ncbi:hypothetical protein ANME2D_00588 [Candidatus Methanoperedens nitroreducens]|uniref:PspA-associated domain-containing protein n=1 Tax=Candidatus Methanoperedens nitratireducens TaxID=1392998 RepID=A0A062VCZ6_9EURY|nr:hypothetical protein [Candidatus Methanoperedens nitroreducens]KCZ73519.1 hypothetical protein ANME2D_00588 [Candidatus Methanoperedens nitroreducens]MDJ1422525.1 hypothetical protein [Candidatus Methanoperedens sp.]